MDQHDRRGRSSHRRHRSFADDLPDAATVPGRQTQPRQAKFVGRFKGDPYDGVQLSYDAGRRNLYLTAEGALRLAFLLAAAVERDIDIR